MDYISKFTCVVFLINFYINAYYFNFFLGGGGAALLNNQFVWKEIVYAS